VLGAAGQAHGQARDRSGFLHEKLALAKAHEAARPLAAVSGAA